MADSPYSRSLALAVILPAGVDVYVALFLGDPSAGGVELTLTGYARVAHQNWATTVPTTGTSRRANIGAILFATITSGGTCDHWAIFDASVGGNRLRSSPIQNIVGEEVTIPINPGDDLRFLDSNVEVNMQEN